MDIQDKKELVKYVSRKPAPSFIFSLVWHTMLLIAMVCIGFEKVPEISPIIIELSTNNEEDGIIIDDEPSVNQEIIDFYAEVEAERAAEKEEMAKTILEPNFKPADISPIQDTIFNPEPQNGNMSLSDINPSDLMGSLSEKLGSNNDSNDMGNPLAGTQMEGGTGGDGQVSGMLKKLSGLGAKRGKITVSLFWNTTDDLDLHLVKATSLPAKGKWFRDMCCFNNQKTEFAHLDIDMNVVPKTNDAVENIYLENFVPGRYGVYVHFYRNHTRIPNVKYTLLFQEEGHKPKVFHGSVNFNRNNYSSKRIHTFWIKKQGVDQAQPESEESPSEEILSPSPFAGV